MSSYSSGPPTWPPRQHGPSQRFKAWVFSHPFLTALVALVFWGLVWSTVIGVATEPDDPDPQGPASADSQPDESDDGDGSGDRDGEDTSDDRAQTGQSRPTTPTEQAAPTDRATPGSNKRQQRQRRPKRYAVLDVVDGDTVHVAYRGDTTIRIIGIDTPETVHPNQPVECGGPAASSAAERLLAGKRVRLVFDPSQGHTDSFGRTLAYLQVPGLGDYGLAMVKRGRAAEYTHDGAYERRARYRAAEDAARATGRGLWGACGGPDVPLEQPSPSDPPAPDDTDGGSGGNCAPGYDPCVPPYPPDLNCDDVDGPIRVTGDDPHRFDADDDGIGCDP